MADYEKSYPHLFNQVDLDLSIFDQYTEIQELVKVERENRLARKGTMLSVLREMIAVFAWMIGIRILNSWVKYTRGSGQPEKEDDVNLVRGTFLLSDDWVSPPESDYPLLWYMNRPKVGVKELDMSLRPILSEIGALYYGNFTHFNANLPRVGIVSTSVHENFRYLNDTRVAVLYEKIRVKFNSLKDAAVTAVIAVSIFRNTSRDDWHHFFRHIDAVLGGTQVIIALSQKEATVFFYKDGKVVGKYTHPIGVSIAVQSGINGQSKQGWDNPEGLDHDSYCEDPDRICVRIRVLGFLPLHLITSAFALEILQMIVDSKAKGGDEDNR